MKSYSISFVGIHNRYILENLIQLYLYDLSNVFDININEDGLFYYDLDNFFGNSDNMAYLIEVNYELVGFIMIDKNFKILDDNIDNSYNLAEIFILNKYRKNGIGKMIVFDFFDNYRGNWEVRSVPLSKDAELFWKKIINVYTNGNYKITEIGQYNRKVFTFNNKTI